MDNIAVYSGCYVTQVSSFALHEFRNSVAVAGVGFRGFRVEGVGFR